MGRKKKERRGRPRTRFPPTPGQFRQMATACAHALADHQTNILMVIPKSMKLEGIGFPRRISVVGGNGKVTVNARRLLDWLYAHGYSTFDAKMFILARKMVLQRIATIQKGLDMDLIVCDDVESTNEGNNDGLL